MLKEKTFKKTNNKATARCDKTATGSRTQESRILGMVGFLGVWEHKGRFRVSLGFTDTDTYWYEYWYGC